MGVKGVIAGLVIIAVAYVLSQIAIPWIKVDLLPSLTMLHPLLPLSIVMYILGGIIIVFSITQNMMIRFFLSAIIIIGVLLSIRGSLPLLVT